MWMSPMQTSFRVLLSEKDQIDISVLLPGQLKAPVEKHQQIGWIQLSVNGFPTVKTQYVVMEETAAKGEGLKWLRRK